jgi:hypothetical protein
LVPPPSAGAAEVERGDVVGRLAGQHGVGQQRHAAADQQRQQQVAQAAHARGQAAGSGETPSIRRGSQRRPSRISTVVTTSTTSCVSQVGRREPDEGDAGHQAADADHDQGRQTVVLGLPGGADGAGNRHQPQATNTPNRNLRPVAPAQAAVQHRHQAGEQAASTSRNSWVCRRRVVSVARCAGPAHHHQALEQALAVEAADQRRVAKRPR